MEGTVQATAQAGSEESTAVLEGLITRFIESEILSQDETVEPDENLFVSGAVDSIGIMRLIAHLEETLAVKIPPRDLVPKNFRTIRAMAEYLEVLSS